MNKTPNWTRLERERQRKDAELYESQLVEPVEYIELNMSNYDEDDVAQLNEWAKWAVVRIEELQRSTGWENDNDTEAVEPMLDNIEGRERE